MGVAYFVDDKPIFLTFEKYSLVCKKMREMGLTTLDEEYSAEFGGKERKDLERKTISFLHNHKDMIDHGKFELEGIEAQEEISTLLDAYRWAYGGFDFYRFKTTWLDPFGGFAPFEYAGADVRYPYGKQFYISKVNPKRLFSKKAEPLIHISINTEKVTRIKGDLSSFEIEFSNDRKMLFFENQYCVI